MKILPIEVKFAAASEEERKLLMPVMAERFKEINYSATNTIKVGDRKPIATNFEGNYPVCETLSKRSKDIALIKKNRKNLNKKMS